MKSDITILCLLCLICTEHICYLKLFSQIDCTTAIDIRIFMNNLFSICSFFTKVFQQIN